MLEGIFDRLLERQAVPTYYGRVPADHVLDDGHDETSFEQENSYLTLRLASMHLKNAGELWRNFLPFTVIVAETLFDGERRTLPFVVGNDLIQKAIEAPLGDRSIEPLNTTVAGPLPYLGGKVGLFLGLFRSTGNDMSRGLFDTVGELAALCGPGQLSSFLSIAEILRKGVYRVFDMKEVEFRFGRKDELDPRSKARNRLESGYLAFVNTPASSLSEDELWVENSVLYSGTEKSDVAFCNHDHCLLAVDCSSDRGHYADLAFQSQWKELRRLIWENQVQKAELFMFPELCKAIVQSPHLTPGDQTAALALYKLKLETEIERFTATTGKGTDKKATRGARSLTDGLDAASMMQKAAYVAGTAARDSEAPRLLGDLATHGAKVLRRNGQPAEGPSDADDDLDAQIAAVRDLQAGSLGTASGLYEALMADVMDTYTR